MRMIDRPDDIIAHTGPSDTMIKNAWYLAAWSHELAADALLARRIVGQAMVFFRAADGVSSLADRCPHRKYPLSAGRLEGETLRCGYHGFRFDPAGTCLGVPGQAKVPAAADVRAYPCGEQYGGIWVFPGDPQLAAAANLPPVPWVTEWWSATGMAPLNARASVLIDNLLDLSHETYLHPGIGTPEVAETPIVVERDGDVLWVRRTMNNVPIPSSYANSTGLTSPIDRWQHIQFFAPSFYVLHVRLAPAGDTGKGYLTKIIYGITPETARTTHNFYGICRDIEKPKNTPYNSQRHTVQEDTGALELLERRLVSDAAVLSEVSIGIDRGGLLGRRMIAEMVRRETTG